MPDIFTASLRPARPGEVFRLVLLRDPGRHARPHKRQKGRFVRVPGLSINDWIGAHYRVRDNLRVEIEALVRRAVEAQNCPAFHWGRPRVTEVYYFRSRHRRDWRNYTGKQLIDAVVRAGVLLDDRDDCVDIQRPIMAYDKNRPRVEIILEHEGGSL